MLTSISFSLLNPHPRFPTAVKKSLRGLQVIFIGCVWQITPIPKDPEKWSLLFFYPTLFCPVADRAVGMDLFAAAFNSGVFLLTNQG
jgi:hypothetical protein